MQNNTSKFNTVLLVIIVVLLGTLLIQSVGLKNKSNENVIPDKSDAFQNNEVNKKPEVLKSETKTVNIKLGPFTNEDNGKTFNVNKGDLIVVESGTYTDGGYTSENLVYDQSMLDLQSHNVVGCDDPRAVGCSVSDVFKFVPIKAGITVIKRSHYRSFDTEKLNLIVTLKIN